MKNIELTGQFKRDAKKQYLELLTPAWAEVLHCLSSGLILPTKYRDHALTGNLKGIRDCHIKPDLILLYRLEAENVTRIRLGSHSELGIT